MVPPLLALLVWPLISIVFFWKLRLPLAILLTILGGFLFMPENTELDLPGIPALDKRSIPALTALILALVFAGPAASDVRPAGLIPRRPSIVLLLVALVAGSVLTALTNSDSLTYGFRTLPGLELYDAASMATAAALMILPLLLARRFLADPEAQRLLLQVLCVAALGYSLLVLFEVRMSPQLNIWVYGFFPHSWIQHVRGGAFRPVVFLGHGLILGIFLCLAILATVALVRIDARRRRLFLLAALWLFGTLMLSRNFGAVFITVALVPVILMLGVRGQLLAAAIISGVFLAYPVARTSQILPIDQMVQLVEGINPERADSFEYRRNHEEILLSKASERPFFGWGGWGRNRIFDEFGRDISVTDGAWVITLGVDGWIGYIARYGLLTLPIFLLLLHRRRYGIGMESAALAVLLAANLIDLVPNSSNTPLTWLLAGALWGRLEWRPAPKSQQQEIAERSGTRASSYRRAKAKKSTNELPVPALLPSQSPYTRQSRRIYRKSSVLKPSPK